MKLQLSDIKKALEGKVIATVEQDMKVDEGIIISLTDGTALSYGYNSCEGWTELNGEQVSL